MELGSLLNAQSGEADNRSTGQMERPPLPANLVRVPIVHQAQGFSCGAAATLTLLRYWRFDSFAGVDESLLYGPLDTTPSQGTEPEPIETFLRQSGLTAHYRSGNVSVEDLERAVDAREPPIVDLQAWRDRPDPWTDTWDAGHYVVLVGYDQDHFYFADPSRGTPKGYAFLRREDLEARWHDLAGPKEVRVFHMAIFVSGMTRWNSDASPPADATHLG